MRPAPPHVWSALLAMLLVCDSDACSAQNSASPVVVAPVVEQQVPTGHRVVGTVVPARTSIVGSAVDGRVVDYFVRAGDQVYEGQPLAQLRTGTLEIELRAAKAELSVRDAELELARIQAESNKQHIAEAAATARRTAILLENAQQKFQRARTLFESGALNQDAHDDLQEAALAAEQDNLAAEAALTRAKAAPGQELIDQARARQLLQQEQVALIEDRLDKFRIQAPFDGFISVEETQQGEWIQQGDPVAEIIQLDEVDVVANVPAEYVVELTLGATVRVELAQAPEQVMVGTVARIVPTADVRTRTFPVHVRTANPIGDGRPLLMAGMLTRIELPAGTLHEVRLVPKDAIVLNGVRKQVYVVDGAPDDASRQLVRSVPVTLGVAVGNLIQVDGNLAAGDLVVTRGNERLTDGQSVMIQEALESGP